MWILATFWGTLFQVAMSVSNWIDQVRMLNKEALRNRNVEGWDEQEEETTIEGLSKKLPWWSPAAMMGKTVGSSDKLEDTASLFEGKNTRV